MIFKIKVIQQKEKKKKKIQSIMQFIHTKFTDFRKQNFDNLSHSKSKLETLISKEKKTDSSINSKESS